MFDQCLWQTVFSVLLVKMGFIKLPDFRLGKKNSYTEGCARFPQASAMFFIP